MTDATSLEDIPAVATKKGDTIKVAVNEESRAQSEPILQDMKVYG